MRLILFWSSISLTVLGAVLAVSAAQASEEGQLFQGMTLLIAAAVLAILYLGTGRGIDRLKADPAAPPPESQ